MIRVNREINSKIEWIAQNVQFVSTKVEEMTSQLTSIEVFLDKISNIDNLVSNLVKIESEIVNLNSYLNNISESSSVVASLINQVTNYSSQLIQLQTKVTKLLCNLEEERRKMEMLTKEVAKAKAYEEILELAKKTVSKIESLKNSLAEREGALTTLHKEALRSVVAVRELELKALNLLSELTMNASKISESVKKLLELEAELNEKYNRRKAELESMERKILNEISEKEKYLREWSEELVKREKEISEKEQLVKVFELELKNKEEEIKRREQLILNLIEELKEKIGEYEEMLRTINMRAIYLEQLESRKEELEETVKYLKNEKEVLLSEIEKLREEAQTLRNEVRSLKIKADDLKKFITQARVAMSLASKSRISSKNN